MAQVQATTAELLKEEAIVEMYVISKYGDQDAAKQHAGKRSGWDSDNRSCPCLAFLLAPSASICIWQLCSIGNRLSRCKQHQKSPDRPCSGSQKKCRIDKDDLQVVDFDEHERQDQEIPKQYKIIFWGAEPNSPLLPKHCWLGGPASFGSSGKLGTDSQIGQL